MQGNELKSRYKCYNSKLSVVSSSECHINVKYFENSLLSVFGKIRIFDIFTHNNISLLFLKMELNSEIMRFHGVIGS